MLLSVENLENICHRTQMEMRVKKNLLFPIGSLIVFSLVLFVKFMFLLADFSCKGLRYAQ